MAIQYDYRLMLKHSPIARLVLTRKKLSEPGAYHVVYVDFPVDIIHPWCSSDCIFRLKIFSFISEYCVPVVRVAKKSSSVLTGLA